jgi:hypothetical protein
MKELLSRACYTLIFLGSKAIITFFIAFFALLRIIEKRTWTCQKTLKYKQYKIFYLLKEKKIRI